MLHHNNNYTRYILCGGFYSLYRDCGLWVDLRLNSLKILRVRILAKNCLKLTQRTKFRFFAQGTFEKRTLKLEFSNFQKIAWAWKFKISFFGSNIWWQNFSKIPTFRIFSEISLRSTMLHITYPRSITSIDSSPFGLESTFISSESFVSIVLKLFMVTNIFP